MRSRLKTLTTITAILVALTAVFVAGAPAAVRRRPRRPLRTALRNAVHRVQPRALIAGAATLFVALGVLLHGAGSAPAHHVEAQSASPAFRLAASSDTTQPPATVPTTVPPTTVPPTTAALNPNNLIWPAHGAIWSPFGRRSRDFHTGDDIGAPYGTPIVAAQTGTVVFAGWESGYGQVTKIDHGGGITTLYAHQSKILVKVGQHVNQGDVIGNVGATGRVTAPHLHFEVRVNGAPQDPMRWLSHATR